MVREPRNSFFKTDTYHIYFQDERRHIKDIHPERDNEFYFFQVSHSNVLERDPRSGDPS